MRDAIPSAVDKVIDSRNVIARIEELEEDRELLVDHIDDRETALNEAVDMPDDELDESPEQDALHEARAALTEWDEGEEGQELKMLKALQEGAEGYCEDWHDGAALIREDYFTDYCQEMLEDCGDLPKNLPGYIVIDWESTAKNLKADYTEVDFDGITYLIR